MVTKVMYVKVQNLMIIDIALSTSLCIIVETISSAKDYDVLACHLNWLELSTTGLPTYFDQKS